MTRNEALQFLITNLAVWPEFAKDGPQLPGFYWVDCDDDPPYLSGGGGVWPIDVTEWVKLRNVAASAPHSQAERALRMRAMVNQVVAEFTAYQDARLEHLHVAFREVAAGKLDLKRDPAPLGVRYLDPATEAAFKWFVLGYAKGGTI